MDRLEYSGKKPGAGRIIKEILKGMILAIVVLMVGLMFYRSCQMTETKASKRFVWNEEALDAYTAAPEEFEVLELRDYNTYKVDDIFTALSPRYVPAIGQFQFSLRYNTKAIKTKYGLIEPSDGELFVFALRDANGRYYTDYDFISDSHDMYEYRRLVFTGVETKDCGKLTLFAFCTADETGPIKANYCDSVDIYVENDATRRYNISKELPGGTGVSPALESYTTVFIETED